MGVYLLEWVEGNIQTSSSFLMTDLRCPVDVLEDKLDRFAAVLAVDDITLLICDNGGCGRAQ